MAAAGTRGVEVMSDLLAPEPEQWGLRGDPWDLVAMGRERLGEILNPVEPARETDLEAFPGMEPIELVRRFFVEA